MDLSSNERKVLRALAGGPLAPPAAAEAAGLGEQEAVSAASWLRTKGLAGIEEAMTEMVGLNDEGLRYAESGLPERRAVAWLEEQGPLTADEARIVIGWLRRKRWATLGKGEGGVLLKPTGDAPEGADEPLLRQLASGAHPIDSLEPEALKLLQGRQILQRSQQVARTFSLTDAGRAALAELGDDNSIISLSTCRRERATSS